MPTQKSSSSIAVNSAVEKYPEFTKQILEHLGKFPSDDFIYIFTSMIKESPITAGQEKNIIESFKLLKKPAPEFVIDFLFEALENEELCQENYAVVIETLWTIIEKKDNIRLIQAIVSFLRDNIEDKGLQEIACTLEDLTKKLE